MKPPRQFWAVTSCPRPGLPDGYLPEFNKYVRSDGPTTPRPFHIFIDDERRGQARNFLDALGAGVDDGADRLNIFEDDGIACVGAFDYIERTPTPTAPVADGTALLSWYAAQLPPGTPHGWHWSDCKSFYGLQAVTFSRWAAKVILDRQVREPWPLPHGGDVMVSRALVGAPWARFCPSLFQHGGDVSVCNPMFTNKPTAPERHSSTFLGQAFDARTLPVFP